MILFLHAMITRGTIIIIQLWIDYDTLTSVNGCDSIVGIHLFIADTTHNTYNINACDNYFGPK